MPLSSYPGNGPNSYKGYKGPGYWRPDIDPEDAHTVVTAGNSSRKHYRQTSKNSSQEDLNPKNHEPQGVAVQKTFVVTSDEV